MFIPLAYLIIIMKFSVYEIPNELRIFCLIFKLSLSLNLNTNYSEVFQYSDLLIDIITCIVIKKQCGNQPENNSPLHTEAK